MTTTTPEKIKFQWSKALVVADSIVAMLRPACERIEIAGSLRRSAARVSDIEILYIPKFGLSIPDGSLFEEMTDLTTVKINHLVACGVLERRENVNGTETFGPQNKLMRHCASGIPVDLFATDSRSWFNYLVCRTGPAGFNIRVANRARALGWKWHPYDAGFSRGEEWRLIESEEGLFEFLGWSYLPPWERKALVP